MNEWKDSWFKYGKVPRHFKHKQALWNGLMEHWELEGSKAVSARNSTNRKSDRNGKGPATHNLGATSKASAAEKLCKETGVYPSSLDVLKVTHTNKKTGEIQDPVARDIVQVVERRQQEYIQSQRIEEGSSGPIVVPVELINEFTYDATPKSRGRVFGLPEESSSSVSSSRYGSSSRLLEENRALTERLKAVEDARAQDKVEAEAARAKDKEDAEARFRALEQQMRDFLSRPRAE